MTEARGRGGASVTGFDVLVFAAEMACYVAVALAGWRVHPLLAPFAVVVMALWWGLLHSPKARIRLPLAVDRGLRALWFGVGVAAAVFVAIG